MSIPSSRSLCPAGRATGRTVSYCQVGAAKAMFEPLETRRLLAADPGGTAAVNAGALEVAIA